MESPTRVAWRRLPWRQWLAKGTLLGLCAATVLGLAAFAMHRDAAVLRHPSLADWWWPYIGLGVGTLLALLAVGFFVIATQNPTEQVGTFPLPESQLDRFLMRIELGYPDRNAERALLSGTDRRDLLAGLDPCMAPGELVELQGNAQRVHVAPALLDYVQAIVEHTRRSPDYAAGLSPRAALALAIAASVRSGDSVVSTPSAIGTPVAPAATAMA